MRGRIVFAATFLLLFGAALALVLNDNSNDPASPPRAGPGPQSVVALPDGRTLVVPQGTRGRDIVEWLNTREEGSQYLVLGVDQFQGETSEPTAESAARLDRLAMVLQSNRDVAVRIIGRLAQTRAPAAGQSLGEQRAQRVRSELIARQIPSGQLLEVGDDKLGLGLSDAPRPPDVRDGRVAILFTRGGSQVSQRAH
jgi:outer membrane protein OmpA-like peptidoglycan-associated protein